MEIFVIHEGEQSGPHRIFELRDMIAAGKFQITDSGWYKGLDSWKPLSEIEALRDAIPESEEQDTTITPVPETAECGILPPTIPEAGDVPQQTSILYTPEALGKRVWIRFGARVVDFAPVIAYGLHFLIEGSICQLNGLPPKTGPIFLMLIAFAWFLIEAVCISTFGTTPGKAVAGLSVVDRQGDRLTIGKSIWRSVLVYIFGWGFGLPILTVFSNLCSLIRMKQVGKVIWDERADSQVLGRPISTGRILLLVAIPIFAIGFTISENAEQLQFIADKLEAEAATKSAPVDPPTQ